MSQGGRRQALPVPVAMPVSSLWAPNSRFWGWSDFRYPGYSLRMASRPFRTSKTARRSGDDSFGEFLHAHRASSSSHVPSLLKSPLGDSPWILLFVAVLILAVAPSGEAVLEFAFHQSGRDAIHCGSTNVPQQSSLLVREDSLQHCAIIGEDGQPCCADLPRSAIEKTVWACWL